MRDDRAFLEDILERIRLTDEFLQPGRDEFFRSRLIQEAVIRNLEIIGEASRGISETLRLQHPEVPWKQIAAFRNFVIHVYWGIKLDRVWEIVEKELPTLESQIVTLLQILDQQASDEAGLDNDQKSQPPLEN
ncbi:MAG: DUF86 domain-containing protein [Chloroflexota bacterium]